MWCYCVQDEEQFADVSECEWVRVSEWVIKVIWLYWIPQSDDEPLNSADDADSDDDEQAIETDNAIVCQFEKVPRHRRI